MLKTLVEPKIHNLRQELETQRQTIIILNERLSENEKRLHFQKKTIESMVKKARENPDQQMQLIEALNQQMNNKLQTAWQ